MSKVISNELPNETPMMSPLFWATTTCRCVNANLRVQKSSGKPTSCFACKQLNSHANVVPNKQQSFSSFTKVRLPNILEFVGFSLRAVIIKVSSGAIQVVLSCKSRREGEIMLCDAFTVDISTRKFAFGSVSSGSNWILNVGETNFPTWEDGPL